jgi:hypothetical protein
MKKLPVLFIACTTVLLCFLACEKAPDNEINDARGALDRADKAGAQAWAGVQLTTGHTFYDSAMKEIAIQNKKLPFNRHYKKAVALLDVAAEAGHYAMEYLQKEQERIRTDCRDRLDAAKNLADGAAEQLKSVSKKPAGKGLQMTLDSAKTLLDDARTALDGDDLHAAEDKTAAACVKTDEIVKKIASSAQKTGAAKR